jgi:hypothetical protein
MARFPPLFTEASAWVFLKHHPHVSREDANDAWVKLNAAGVTPGRMYEALDTYFAREIVTLTPLERKIAEEIGCDPVSYAKGKLRRDQDKDRVRDIYSLPKQTEQFYDKDGRPIGRFGK